MTQGKNNLATKEDILDLKRDIKDILEMLNHFATQVDQRFASHDQRFESMDKKFESFDQQLKSLKEEMNNQFSDVKAEIAFLKRDFFKMQDRLDVIDRKVTSNTEDLNAFLPQMATKAYVDKKIEGLRFANRASY